MPGWIAQEYAKVPGWSNFTENDWLEESGPDASIRDSFVNVTVCGDSSLFTHRTIEPALTVTLGGLNAMFLMEILLSDTDGVVVLGRGVEVITGGAVVATADGVGCACCDCGCEHPLTTKRSMMHRKNKTIRFID